MKIVCIQFFMDLKTITNQSSLSKTEMKAEIQELKEKMVRKQEMTHK